MATEIHRVFAYGSNMNLGDLNRWLQCNNYPTNRVQSIIPARLPGYRLAWNYWSESREGGAANVEKSPNDEVLGGILEIDPTLLRAIDAKEGHPKRYSRLPHPIECFELSNSAGQLVWLYQVTPEFRCDEEKLPTPDYLRIVIQGAQALGLPEDYIKELASILPPPP